jgi:1,2-diacylglycerol 3-beta-galactosyltransferase
MPGTEYAGGAAATPAPLLFLIADTGGGHRNAARAVGQALDRMYPGRFAPVLCDPLSGPGSARLLRWVTSLYGPAIRLAPWLWGAAYHVCNSRPAMGLLRRTLLQLADRPAADAARAHRPVAIVSFHPLTGMAAVSAKDQASPGTAVVTIVTDLATMHAAWRYADADLIIAPLGAVSGHRQPQPPGGGAPSGAVSARRSPQRPGGGPSGAVSGHRQPQRPGGGEPSGAVSARRSPQRPGGGRWASAGSPVTREFWGGPLQPDERAILRRSLGVGENRFLVLLTGGGEGSGGIARRAVAILRRFDDVDVVAVCGHNLRLKRRLDRLAARSGGRLTVTGFVRNMADWLRCCDLVVSKAGPGTIAEATCCGMPLLLTSHLPGQEKGNTEFVTGADAGRHVPSVRRLITEIARLRDDRAAVDAMRAASARLGRPAAAAHIAELIADLVPAGSPDSRHGDHGSSHTRHDSHNGHDSHTGHSDGARDGDQAEADSMITEYPRHMRTLAHISGWFRGLVF